MISHVRLALALAVSLTACRSLPGESKGEARLGQPSAGRSEVVVERPTTSLALDRITKRQPALNGVVRRPGVGRGVAIYVFDGGVDADHPELAGRVRIGYDAFPRRPRICNAHGTAVAGAAAGATLGVAPAAEIIDVKIINCTTGLGSIASVRAAARWVVNDHRRHPGHPAVANWSFIVDTSRVIPAIDSAIALLHDAGILVVSSAGNLEIDACRVSPANSHRALVVGASSVKRRSSHSAWQDLRTRGTAWGRCIDIYAPGDSVLLPATDTGGPATSLWNGTSMAAGYVSGAAAIVLERNPRARPSAVSTILQHSATIGAVEERISSSIPRLAPLLYVGPE